MLPSFFFLAPKKKTMPCNAFDSVLRILLLSLWIMMIIHDDYYYYYYSPYIYEYLCILQLVFIVIFNITYIQFSTSSMNLNLFVLLLFCLLYVFCSFRAQINVARGKRMGCTVETGISKSANLCIHIYIHYYHMYYAYIISLLLLFCHSVFEWEECMSLTVFSMRAKNSISTEMPSICRWEMHSYSTIIRL